MANTHGVNATTYVGSRLTTSSDRGSTPLASTSLIADDLCWHFSIYDNKTGKLIVSTDPAYGFSRENDGTVLIFFSWRKNDMGVDFSENPPKVTRPEGGH